MQETLYDELAEKLGMDRLEFRLKNALRNGAETVTGQRLEAASASSTCLEALRPHWTRALADAEAFNAAQRATASAASASPPAGMAAATPRCPTPRPSSSASRPTASVVLHQGAVDIGQGSNTVIAQICRRRARPAARRLPAERAPTRRSRPMPARPRPRARPSSPARRPRRPARALREKILRFANVSAAGDAVASTARRWSIARRRGGAGASISPRCRPMRDGLVFGARGNLRPADRCRSTPRARASPMPSMAMARRSPNSRST